MPQDITTKPPLISVVVPCYNAQQWLPKCLDSLLAQTYKNFEIIAVCDGATDRTAEILKAYAAADARVKPLFQENQGVSAARNNGIDRTKGEFIAFVDADDYVSKDYLAVLYKILYDHDADIAVCNFYFELLNGVKLRHWLFYGSRCVDGAAAVKLNMELYRFPTFIWNKLYRRSLFFEPELKFPQMYYEDVAVLFNLMLKADKVAITFKPLYHYIRHNSSITANFKPKHARDYMKACNGVRYTIWQHGLWETMQKAYEVFLKKVRFQIKMTLRSQQRYTKQDKERIMSLVDNNIKMMKQEPQYMADNPLELLYDCNFDDLREAK